MAAIQTSGHTLNTETLIATYRHKRLIFDRYSCLNTSSHEGAKAKSINAHIIPVSVPVFEAVLL